MLLILCLFQLFSLSLSQNPLSPMNRCLGNCAVCKIDELETCSGVQQVNCMKGFDGINCSPKQTMAASLTLMDSLSSNTSSSIWSDNSRVQCFYTNSKKEIKKVNVLGLYKLSLQNSVTVQIKPNYQNYILTFNLVRGSWTPYTDTVGVSIVDQSDNSLYSEIIQFLRRDEINPSVNLLRCKNNSPRILQKYQIEGVINPEVVKKITIKFDGYMEFEADWGLTNVKISFGCSKFLTYDGTNCRTCTEGFYMLTSVNKTILGCEPCPLGCSKCIQNAICTSCIQNYTLKNGECQNNLSFIITPATGRSLNCSNRIILQSNTSTADERLVIQINLLPPHKKIRAIFYLTYVPELFHTTDVIRVLVDSNQSNQIKITDIKMSAYKQKQSCNGFANGYYSVIKIVTPYFDHTLQKINITLIAKSGFKMGAYQIGFDYQFYNETATNKSTNQTSSNNSSSITNTTNSNNTIVLPPILPNTTVINTTTNTTNNTSNKTNAVNQTQNSTISNTTTTNTTNNMTNSTNNNNSTNATNTNTTNTINTTNTTTNNNTNSTNSTKNNTTNTTNNNTNTNNSTNNATISNITHNNTNITKNNTDTSNITTNHTNNTANATNSTTNSTTNNTTNNTTNIAVELTKEQRQLLETVEKIQKQKSNIRIGIKQQQNIIITILYPFQINQYPYVIATLLNSGQVIIPQQTSNNGQSQQLTLRLDQSFIDQNIKVSISHRSPLQTSRKRMLQFFNPIEIGQIYVTRYDKLSATQWSSINKYGTFFQVVSWITIISTIVFSFFGSSVITQKFSILLQILFLHIYIYSEYLPVNFKYTLSGLSRMQNLDYFQTNVADAIQKFLLGNVIQNSPTKFTLFNKDINFTRSIYPCLFISILYLIWFILINVIRKFIQIDLKVSQVEQQRTRSQRLKLFLIRVGERYLNFWYQVWQYMFIVIMWSAFIQFHNLAYPSGANRSLIPNIIFCFIVLLFSFAVPIFTFKHLKKTYFKIDYFEYSYWNQNIFFLELPEESLPSEHHPIPMLVRNSRYVLLVICFAYLGDFPIPCLIIIIFIHLANMVYMKEKNTQTRVINTIFNFVQHILLIILAIIMLIAYGTSTTLSTSYYMIIGHVLTTCCLIIVIIGLIRVIYYIYEKLNDRIVERQVSQFKPAMGTERIV